MSLERALADIDEMIAYCVSNKRSLVVTPEGWDELAADLRNLRAYLLREQAEAGKSGVQMLDYFIEECERPCDEDPEDWNCDSRVVAKRLRVIRARLARPAEEGLRWIPVSERLPDEGIEVLVEVDGHRGPSWRNNHNLVAYMDRAGKFWEERHQSETSLPITYWMPLPEPPDAALELGKGGGE